VIDLKELRDNPDMARRSQRARGAQESIVDDILSADALHRTSLARFEELRAAQKVCGKEVASASADEKPALLAKAKHLAQEVKDASAQATTTEKALSDLLATLANIVEDGAPAGGEENFAVVREVGTIRDFHAEGFEPRGHEVIGTLIGGIDIERGAKVSGSRFYFLTGPGARLELALLNFGMDRAISAGFIPTITPTLVRPDIMFGTGFLGEHSDEVYYLPADELYLTGTSEVALAGLHSDEILDLSDGPLRYAGFSACYRREAGSHGKDTKGIFRVHQFHKVEMFSYVHAGDAHEEHKRLLALQESIFQDLELPYRVIDVAAGDLGTSAARKFDCEAWIPSQGRYRELTSTSNCTTFQARRLLIRERTEDGITPVATLNGTVINTRWLVALLENHQLGDGSVRIPNLLRPYLGGLERLPAIA
jgi:seryl-tRNA synthetase